MPIDQSATVKGPKPREDVTIPTKPNALEEEFAGTDEDNFDFLTSDMDLGGFDTPLEHVTMADVLKKDRSPPGDQNSTMLQQSQCFEDTLEFNNDISDNLADFAGLTSNDGLQVDDVIGKQIADVTMDAETPAESLVKTPGDPEASTANHVNSCMDESVPRHETGEERSKRLYDEDQKKKWEGLDRWMYDEFHEFVELI